MARNVTVTLGANVQGFIAGMQRAGAAVDNVTSRMARSARDNSQEWNTVGTTLTRVGMVAAAGLGFAAKAAMDWESAWAGVRKTVDQSSPAFATLEGDLREMARTMATSHTEIAAVAEAAGALGVATEDVAGFTRTMIMLGETTNLTAEEAADSLAQFMNVMGTAPDQVNNLGAALVALGNDGASTERQIVQMSQRIAGAGRQIGLSEAEVMGFASAMASVGIEVEAGGTAISMTMLKMEQAVRNGGRELDILASTAGMSAADFKQAFQTDAAGAIDAFVQGLGRIQASGGDVTGVLRDLGITGTREADTLRRLASSGTMLADSLNTARDAMADGNALLDEYGERANTTESKVKVAWNNIKDAAITAGAEILPAIASMADGIADLARWVGDLDPAAIKFGVSAVALVAAIGLIGGGAIKAIVGLVELRAALVALGAGNLVSSLGRVGPAIAAIARYAVPAAAALGALAIIAEIRADADRAVPSLDAMTRALQRLGEAGQTVATSGIDEMFKSQTFDDASIAVGRIDGLADAFVRLQNLTQSDEIAMWWDRNLGIGQSSQATHAAESIGVLDQSLTKLVETGRSAQAQSAFEQIYQEATKAGVPIEALSTQYFPEYRAALQRVAEQAQYTVKSEQEMVDWMRGKIPPAVQAAAESNKELAAELAKVSGNAQNATMSMQDYANQLLALSGAEIAVEQAIANVNEALKENGRNIDLTTEKGRENVSALNALGQASMQRIQTLADQGVAEAEQARQMERARAEYVRVAQAMGYNEAEARKMADALFATVAPNQQAADAARNFARDAAMGSAAATALSNALIAIPANTEITVTAPGMDPIKATAETLGESIRNLPPDKVITVTMPNGQVVTGTVAEIEAGLRNMETQKEILLRILGDTSGAVEVQGALDGTNGKIVLVGTESDLGGQIKTQMGVDSTTGKVVIVGTESDISGKVRTQIAVDATTGKTVWVRTEGDTSGADRVRNVLAGLRDRTVYVTTVQRTIGVTSRDAFGGATRADGGLISRGDWTPSGLAHIGAQRFDIGGMVAGWSPHARADNIPAWLTAGEVVQSNAAGDLYGRDRLLALNARLIDPAAFNAFMAAQGFADGGKAKEAFHRAPQTSWPTSTATAPSVGSQRVINQEYNIYYPVAERMSQATRRAASQSGVEAML